MHSVHQSMEDKAQTKVRRNQYQRSFGQHSSGFNCDWMIGTQGKNITRVDPELVKKVPDPEILLN